MDKKNLSLPLGQLSVEHIPPRLVEARQGWYFIFYQVDPSTGQLDRHRKSYNIGRINGITARRKRAKELLSQIEELLRVGYPWANGKAVYEFHRFIGAYKATAATTTVFEVEGKAGDVILETVEILCRSLREETTGRTYRSRAKLFVKWLEKKGFVQCDQSVYLGDYHLFFVGFEFFGVSRNSTLCKKIAEKKWLKKSG